MISAKFSLSVLIFGIIFCYGEDTAPRTRKPTGGGIIFPDSPLHPESHVKIQKYILNEKLECLDESKSDGPFYALFYLYNICMASSRDLNQILSNNKKSGQAYFIENCGCVKNILTEENKKNQKFYTYYQCDIYRQHNQSQDLPLRPKSDVKIQMYILNERLECLEEPNKSIPFYKLFYSKNKCLEVRKLFQAQLSNNWNSHQAYFIEKNRCVRKNLNRANINVKKFLTLYQCEIYRKQQNEEQESRPLSSLSKGANQKTPERYTPFPVSNGSSLFHGNTFLNATYDCVQTDVFNKKGIFGTTAECRVASENMKGEYSENIENKQFYVIDEENKCTKQPSGTEYQMENLSKYFLTSYDCEIGRNIQLLILERGRVK